jgi:leader peptidase (prepilin peptidase)/N-methyltransferase
MNIGWGDVKYAGVVGFYIGLTGLFQAIMIMSISLGVFAIYLLLSKKGNLKTMAPMGPAFSLGFFVTILFPIITNIYYSYGG